MTAVIRTLAGVAAAVLVLAAPASAQSPQARPLPDADLVTTEGGLVKLAALAQEGQWLLVYVGETSPPSQRLLDAMAGWGLDAALGRVVVVVSVAADATPMAAQYGERLPGVRWASDPSGAIARGAGLRGAPTVIGARGGEIGWVLAGVLNDPTMIRDVIKGWLRP